MKTIADILQGLTPVAVQGDTAMSVEHVTIDSRTVDAGACFIAIVGTNSNGHQFIDQAINKGATCIVCSEMPQQVQSNVCYVLVKNTSEVAGNVAANFYNHPSKQMHVIGITGTNGKTTIATLGYQLFSGLGYNCGLISTVQNIIGTTVSESTHTTPDPVSLQRLLRTMADAGCAYVFMEVSSHAVVQHRIAGILFAVALFSNISHDHLDYHGTFDNYIAAKKKFFDDLPATAFAITNIDDRRGAVMLQNTAAQKKTYALKNIADFKAKILENTIVGLYLDINGTPLHCSLIGEFNAYNLLAIYAISKCLDISDEELLPVLTTLKGAPGRFDVVRSTKQNILGIVDYAHTPDALINVLATINKLREGNEKVITVVGCGGDRDKTKRPIMAKVACEHSTKVVFTSDNPRSEEPQQIINDMQAGVPPHQVRKYISVIDRKEAIRAACMLAQRGDIVLVAGKGHETYQEFSTGRIDFDDKQILQQTFDTLEL